MCRRQRVVAGFAAQRAVLRWCRFKILSLWRRHIWPVFALLEAWRALSGCSCGSSGRRRGWSQVAMGRARSIGQGRPGVPVPRVVAGFAVQRAVLRWFRFKILSLWRWHTRPSFAVSPSLGWRLGSWLRTAPAGGASCDGARGEGFPQKPSLVSATRRPDRLRSELASVSESSCSRSVPIWSHCRDRVNIRRVIAVI